MADENPKSAAIKAGPLFITGWFVAVIVVLIALAGRLVTPWERAARRRRPVVSPIVGGAR